MCTTVKLYNHLRNNHLRNNHQRKMATSLWWPFFYLARRVIEQPETQLDGFSLCLKRLRWSRVVATHRMLEVAIWALLRLVLPGIAQQQLPVAWRVAGCYRHCPDYRCGHRSIPVYQDSCATYWQHHQVFVPHLRLMYPSPIQS